MTELSWYASLILFTISTCGTPGPNNYMVMSSGLTYGIRRSLPHVIGINIGFPLMVIAVGLGLGSALHAFPAVYDILRPIGVIYLLYLAYRTATAPVSTEEVAARGKPLTILQASLFQLVNPKAWVMAIGALVTYGASTGPTVPQVLMIALVFFVFGSPCTCAWLWIGASLKRLLTRPGTARAFNLGMALLLVISMVPTIIEVVESMSR